MSAFLSLAALLVLGSIAWLVRPLWAGSRRLAIGLSLAMIVASGALYAWLGTPAALDPARRNASTPDSAIAALREELRRDPTQPEGWRLLAQAYSAAGERSDARAAWQRAVALRPDDPDLLTEAAQASAALADGRRFDDAAVGWLRHALQVRPDHQRARWFLGIAQRQRGEHAAAVQTWQPLLAQVDAKTAASLQVQIDAARAVAGLPPGAQGDQQPALAGIDISVQIDPALAAQFSQSPNAAVFVIARAPGGPPMPVAVERHAIRQWPLQVKLDDADSPMPTRRLSSLDEVEVLARLSLNGTANLQPGDLESRAVRVRLPAAQPIALRIDRARSQTR